MDNDRVSQLLARIGREDEAAFRELYKAFSRKVFAYVLDMLNDHARAEEVLVDTMYEVWRYPARFHGDSAFGTWLLAIARRKARLLPRGPAPAAASGDRSAICIGALADELRECMHLVFAAGLGVADVARLQDCPEGTVTSRLADARRQVRACLQQGLQPREAAA